MPKNIFTKRDELICGKLDKLSELIFLHSEGNAEMVHESLRLIQTIRQDAISMENKLIVRKGEAEDLKHKSLQYEEPLENWLAL